MQNIYKWKNPIYSVPAQDAGERIEELNKIHGEVTPQIMVDDARPESAVLHPCYEWDDSKAAEKYRCHQSKKIIGNLHVVRIADARKEVSVRGFVSINGRNEKASYRPFVVAMSEEKTKEQVIKNAKEELRYFKSKYENIIDVISVLKSFLEEISA